MKNLLIGLLLPVCLMAQVTRIFEYEKDGTDQVHRLIPLMQTPGLKIQVDPVLGLVSIFTDSEEKAAAAEQTFRKHYKAKALVVADRNVELTLHVLYAKAGSKEPSETVPALTPVIQQLKQATTLSTFRSVETQIVRVRSGKKVESSGVLNWTETPDNSSPTYQFQSKVSVDGNSIKLDELKFGVRVPFKVGENMFQFREVGITSTFDVKPGQLVVVGKTNTSGSDGALILVLTAKLVD
jgi:hypothetical protein